MQNFIKSQTRLAFIQYIFQSEFINFNSNESMEDFQNYFFNSNIAIIGERKEFKLKFNKNFLKKLSENYLKNFDKKKIVNKIDQFTDLDIKFDKWNIVLKSIIFAFISELDLIEKHKIKIIFNDYINISKSLVSSKETKLMNAIIQRFLDEKKSS